MRSGRQEGLPYSLSRWTDVSGTPAKWAWWQEALAHKSMVGFDPRTAVPAHWSLEPDETLGLIFWTKDPSRLIEDHEALRPYRVRIHHTVTGWEEAELGAPCLSDAARLLGETIRVFGPEAVRWRFSPVPLVEDVRERFEIIAKVAGQAGLDRTYLSFLQTNDRMAETRAEEERLRILRDLARIGESYGVQILLCNEDRLLSGYPQVHPNLAAGICAPPEDFDVPGAPPSPSEGCGCGLAVDPFTVNESCGFGCRFCYAADQSLSVRKRNTTKALRVLP